MRLQSSVKPGSLEYHDLFPFHPADLQIPNNSQEAEDLAKVLQEGGGLPGLVADHVLRKHVFPLFVVTAVMFTLYVVYKIVGDPVLRLIKVHRPIGEACYRIMSKKINVACAASFGVLKSRLSDFGVAQLACRPAHVGCILLSRPSELHL